MFDLAQDPYEINNLRNTPAATNLLARLATEYDRQKAASAFVLPIFDADPDEIGAVAAQNAWVLDYKFNEDKGDSVADASGKSNRGRADNAPLTKSRDGAKARKFGGDGHLEVPKSPSLNPAGKNWTVEAVFKSDTPDGIVLAHGGGSYGYCLAIEDGHPAFTVVGRRTATHVVVNESVIGKWATVRAVITKSDVTLTLAGAPPVRVKLSAALNKNPTEGLQIGDDLDTKVVSDKKLPAFRGLVESVRIYDGVAP